MRCGARPPSAVAVFSFSAGAQELNDYQRTEMLNCALHGGGGWVESSLRGDGKVRFTYTLEPSENRGSRELYVAFWNPALDNQGELLVFDLAKTSDHKDMFVLINQGLIWDNNGRLDIRDPLGGIYTRRKIQSLLPKLKRKAPQLAEIGQVQAGSAVCKTPTDSRGE
jgi:hypothetical protein